MKRVTVAAAALGVLGWFLIFLPAAFAAEEKKEAPPKDEPKKEAPKEEAKPAPKKEEPKAAPKKEEPKASPKKVEPKAEEKVPVPEPALAWPWAKKAEIEVHGEITEKYRVRNTDGESDQDFEGHLDLEVKNLFQDKLNIYMNVGVFWDLWGRQDSRNAGEVFYFGDIFDTYETKVQGRVYSLVAEAEDLVKDLDLRFGRQMLHKGEHLHFDGLSLSYAPSDVFEVTIGGGLPVYFSEPHWTTNFLAAVYLEIYPGFAIASLPKRATKITFEYIHVHEGDPELDDDFISLQLWQRLFGGAATVYLKGGFLNGKTRDMQAIFSARCPYSGLQLRLRFVSSPSVWGDMEDGELEELTIDNSPFLGIMGIYQPYRQFDLTLHKQFCPFFGAELAYSGRTPTQDRYEGRFNHDFDRFAGTTYFSDPFDAGLELAVSGEFWASNGPNEDNNNLTWGADLNYRPNDKVRVCVGTHFLKYRVVYEPDQFTRVSEKSDVRVMSLGMDFKPTPCIRLGVRYEMESDEGWHDRTFDTLVVRAGFQF